MPEFPLSERLIDYTGGDVASELDPIPADVAVNLIAADDDLFDLDKEPFQKLTRNTLFDVPNYQRLYSWKDEQNREFWREFSDLLDSHLEEAMETDVEDVFFGTMFLARESEDDPWEVIDGQQRLTSAFILLKCILDRLDQYEEDLIDEIELVEEKRKLRNIIYMETETGAERNPSISLNKHDSEFFTYLMRDEADCIEALWNGEDIDGRKSEAYKLSTFVKKLRISDEALIEAGIIDEDGDDDSNPLKSEFRSVYDSNENLIDAFVFFQERLDEVFQRVEEGLREQEIDPDENSRERKRREVIALLNITNFLLNAFHVGRFEITASESELRLTIFEILNSRGLELTDTDKIRASVINFAKSPRAPDGLLEEWRKIETRFNADNDVIERFLKTYIASTIENINSISEAADYLLQAFSPRADERRTRVESFLADKENPKEVLEEISQYGEWYYEIVKTDELSGYSELNLNGSTPNLTDVYLRLRRLNSLAKQWHPSVLSAYAVACEDGDQIDELVNLLGIIEVITLRRLIVGASPSVVEELHARGASQFWNVRGETDTNGAEATEDTETESESKNEFDHLWGWLVKEFRRRVPTAFDETFVQTLIQQEDWSSAHMKGLWAKRAAEGLSPTGMVPESYNPDVATLEHILPATPIREGDDDPYLWLTRFFEIDNPTVVNPDEELDDDSLEEFDDIQREVIELVRRHKDEEIDADQDGEIERIQNLVHSLFVEEVANTVLLGSRDNSGVKNSDFAKKFYFYHRSDAGFSDLDSNWYFTAEGPTIQEDWIETIDDEVEEVENGDYPDMEDVFDEPTISDLNDFWTYRELIRRRLYELPHLINTLSFDILPEDFESDISDLDESELREKRRMILDEAQASGINVTEADFSDIFDGEG